jgi:hypothetical protein
MERQMAVEDMFLNYNPERPAEEFKTKAFADFIVAEAATRMPVAVPWPAGKAPTRTPEDRPCT